MVKIDFLDAGIHLSFTSMLAKTLAVLCSAAATLVIFVWNHRRKIKEPKDTRLVSQNVQNVRIRNKMLRVVFKEHELKENVPLLVFVHGFGGQLAQWTPLLTFFSQTCNVLAYDMVGHGKSEAPDRPEEYTTDSLTKDLITLLQNYPNKNIVLLGHSYGCHLVNLAYNSMPTHINALIILSPAMYIPEKENQGPLLRLPNFVLYLLRIMDSWGNENSNSVYRMVHQSAKVEVRRRQAFWGRSFKTRILRYAASGQRDYIDADAANIKCPVLILAGKNDEITPVKSEQEILEGVQPYLSNPHRLHFAILKSFSDPFEVYSSQNFPTNFPKPIIIPNCGHLPQYEHPEFVRGNINRFLIEVAHLTSMDPSVQLMAKQKDQDKWNVKNFEKWRNTEFISMTTIGPSLFRAMKVLRQNDPDHSPQQFHNRNPEVGLVVDISQPPPPYDPESLETVGVKYLKLSTQSKVPPTREEVSQFIQHCDSFWNTHASQHIGVHCHYGFNRTGFMICCYLIERHQYSVEKALLAFKTARKPGVRHLHFVDELYLRYVGD